MSNTTDFSAIVGGDYSTDITAACSCQASIAEKENKIFARALAVSYAQDAIPVIPHLSYSEDDAEFIRTQDEVSVRLHRIMVRAWQNRVPVECNSESNTRLPVLWGSVIKQ